MEELRIRDILAQRQIPISHFAKMIGVTREHCYNIVAGRNLSWGKMQKMAQVLNVPIRALFTPPDLLVSDNDPYEIVYGRTEIYKPNDIITFCEVNETWGEFSNMSTAFAVEVNGEYCKTSEHLFIALRFSGHPQLQREILDYDNSMWCKKIFVNKEGYKPLHHPNWHDNYFDVEVMKYIVNLKYQQNPNFRKLLTKTKGKILVEDTSSQNNSNNVSRWGAQDIRKKYLISRIKSDVNKFITQKEKEYEVHDSSLKKPRSKENQALTDAKRKVEIATAETLKDYIKQSIRTHCNIELVGQNALGKMLTEIRDKGYLEYHLSYPLFLFDKEIK